MRLGWAALLVSSVLGCGNGSATARDAEPRAWRFSQFVDTAHGSAAVLTADNKLAIVGADGRVSEPIPVAPDRDGVTARGAGKLIVVESGGHLHVFDVAGREIWRQAVLPGARSLGDTSLAVADGKRTTLIALATGKPVYSGAAAQQVHRASDGFVFASASELWFVHEGSARERWRRNVPRLDGVALLDVSGRLYVIRPDHTYEQLEYTHGSILSSGVCDPPAFPDPDAGDRAAPLPCAGSPPAREVRQEIRPRSPDGGDYFIVENPSKSQVGEAMLLARDLVGRARWTSAWPAGEIINERARIASSANLVAFVAESAGGERRLAVYDDSNGQLLFERSLGRFDRVAGFAETCWLVVNDRAADCIEARTGATTWSVVVFGAKVDAWPLKGGGALVADGTPLSLSRVDNDGARLWQVEMPETDLVRPAKLDAHGSLKRATPMGAEHWEFSAAMGITSGGMQHQAGLTVLDLASGKLTRVK